MGSPSEWEVASSASDRQRSNFKSCVLHISFISSSSGGSLGPVLPLCAQMWLKTPFIHSFIYSFIHLFIYITYSNELCSLFQYIWPHSIDSADLSLKTFSIDHFPISKNVPTVSHPVRQWAANITEMISWCCLMSVMSVFFLIGYSINITLHQLFIDIGNS